VLKSPDISIVREQKSFFSCNKSILWHFRIYSQLKWRQLCKWDGMQTKPEAVLHGALKNGKGPSSTRNGAFSLVYIGGQRLLKVEMGPVVNVHSAEPVVA
jgi:hypothetical protein